MVGAIAAAVRRPAWRARSRARPCTCVPPIGLLDSIGGLVAGAVLGLAVVWVAGAAALQLPNAVPGLPHLHQQVEQSVILKRLNTTVSPRTILRAFARVDPFPQVNGLVTPTAPIPAHVLAPAGVAPAAPQRGARAHDRVRARDRGQRLGRPRRTS